MAGAGTLHARRRRHRRTVQRFAIAPLLDPRKWCAKLGKASGAGLSRPAPRETAASRLPAREPR